MRISYPVQQDDQEFEANAALFGMMSDRVMLSDTVRLRIRLTLAGGVNRRGTKASPEDIQPGCRRVHPAVTCRKILHIRLPGLGSEVTRPTTIFLR